MSNLQAGGMVLACTWTLLAEPVSQGSDGCYTLPLRQVTARRKNHVGGADCCWPQHKPSTASQVRAGRQQSWRSCRPKEPQPCQSHVDSTCSRQYSLLQVAKLAQLLGAQATAVEVMSVPRASVPVTPSSQGWVAVGFTPAAHAA